MTLASVKRIYIEPMENNLDPHLRAEFMKKMKNRVTIVPEKDDADAILTGVTEKEKGTGAKVTGRYLGLHDVAAGTASLVSKDGKTLLWSEEAGGRSLF